MKYLVIFAHPNTDSLNGYFKQAICDQLVSDGNEVEVRDLYKLRFDPVLSLQDMEGQRRGVVSHDVKKEQDFIVQADFILILHPIWWTGLPAIMKGYIDRVFSYGFAYRYEAGVQKGLLGGKQVMIINTHGKSSSEYVDTEMDRALSLTSDLGIYQYCGLEVVQHLYVEKADRMTAEIAASWLSRIKKSLTRIGTLSGA